MNDTVIYPKSREAVSMILNYLVDQGWIKDPNGLYDELSRLEDYMEGIFENQDKLFRDYLAYLGKIHHTSHPKLIDPSMTITMTDCSDNFCQLILKSIRKTPQKSSQKSSQNI